GRLFRPLSGNENISVQTSSQTSRNTCQPTGRPSSGEISDPENQCRGPQVRPQGRGLCIRYRDATCLSRLTRPGNGCLGLTNHQSYASILCLSFLRRWVKP